MSYPRRLATLTAAVAAAVVVLLCLDGAAYAADTVRVELRGLGGTPVSAGEQGVAFQATFTNLTGERIESVTSIIAVHLEGARPESIRLRRRQGGGDLPRQSSGGSVIFADTEPFDLQRDGDRPPTRQYSLSFTREAPGGEATVTVAAYKDGTTLGSASGSITVVAGRGGPQATETTPPNTDPGVQPTFDAGPTYSLAPLPVAEKPARLQASVPKSLYVLGSLLIVMGAASLFLIFRPPGGVRARVAGAGPHRLPGPPSWHSRGAPAPQAWPTVGRPAPDPLPPDPLPGPPPGPPSAGRGRASGPHTGMTRPIRDPGPGEGPWPRP